MSDETTTATAATTSLNGAGGGDGHNGKKKHHHKRRKKQVQAGVQSTESNREEKDEEAPQPQTTTVPNGVDIEYVVEKPSNIDPEFGEVFNRLARIKPEGEESSAQVPLEATVDGILESLSAEVNELGKESKREFRKKNRPTVAQLKQIVPRPAVVEMHDVTSPDPELLVFLKSRRMAVPVPRHWSSSTRFLSGKRASDRKPYQLPDYIANTGIGKLREASDDTNDSVQKRMRERARPKLGRIEIDYQVLYDAFFKYQTKPKLTQHAELFYEGKDSEKDFSRFVAGVVSDELRNALGMPTVERDGKQVAEQYAPPWILNMQRFGPPPSYPGVKYPGVNAPLPSGAQYGVQPGGWGKPPLDQFGRGLFGDVLGTTGSEAVSQHDQQEQVKLWGDFQVFDEEEDAEASRSKRQRFEEEEEEETGEEEQDVEMGAPPSTSFVPPTSHTKTEKSLVPEEIVDLRKKPIQPPATMPQQAYRVLEKETTAPASSSSEVFGASHRYALNADKGVAISIAPEQLQDEGGVDKAKLTKLYEEERMRTQPAMGLAPGAGHVDLAEIEQQALSKKKEKDKKDKKKSLKGYEF